MISQEAFATLRATASQIGSPANWSIAQSAARPNIEGKVRAAAASLGIGSLFEIQAMWAKLSSNPTAKLIPGWFLIVTEPGPDGRQAEKEYAVFEADIQAPFTANVQVPGHLLPDDLTVITETSPLLTDVEYSPGDLAGSAVVSGTLECKRFVLQGRIYLPWNSVGSEEGLIY